MKAKKRESSRKKKMIQRLGDGSCICEECWRREYPKMELPENNWIFDRCDICKD